MRKRQWWWDDTLATVSMLSMTILVVGELFLLVLKECLVDRDENQVLS